MLMKQARGGMEIEYSIIDSKSAFESSLSFPFALIASYYALNAKWVKSSLYLLLVFISLKRIAIIAVIITILLKFLPKQIRELIINPYLILILVLSVVSITIAFAYGYFDEYIHELVGKAANDLSKGRHRLWFEALTVSNFSLGNFIYYGVGIGKVISLLQENYGHDKILLHNDLLSLLLEFGFVILIGFILLLLLQKTTKQRIFVLNILILFFTDNVIIYQHVMVVFLLLISQLGNDSDQKKLKR
jgi:hypothetical protein